MNRADWKNLYRRPEWKKKRDSVVAAAGGRCQKCGTDKKLQVHHPRYQTGKMPWEYDDLMCLCASCHRKADWERKTGLSPTMTRNPLCGKFFHSIDQDGVVCWQGYVIGEAQPGFFLVQLFEWMMGEPSTCEIVPFEDMLDWFFYQSADEMRFSYDHGAARRRKAKLKDDDHAS